MVRRHPAISVPGLTIEGLRRLVTAARRIGLDQALITAIGKSGAFARGPKLGKMLREIGLATTITTDKSAS